MEGAEPGRPRLLPGRAEVVVPSSQTCLCVCVVVLRRVSRGERDEMVPPHNASKIRYKRTRSTSSSTDLSCRAARAGAAGATTSATSVASSSRPERRALLGLLAPLGTGAATSAWRTTRTGERAGACGWGCCCCCSPAASPVVVVVVAAARCCACLSATRQATQQRFARALLLPAVARREEVVVVASLPLPAAGSRPQARCAAVKAASWRPSSRRAVVCCVCVCVCSCVCMCVSDVICICTCIGHRHTRARTVRLRAQRLLLPRRVARLEERQQGVAQRGHLSPPLRLPLAAALVVPVPAVLLRTAAGGVWRRGGRGGGGKVKGVGPVGVNSDG